MRRTPRHIRSDGTRSNTPVITFRACAGRKFVPFIRRHITRAHGMLPRAPREVSFALVGNSVMSRLHQQFLGIPRPTDVLSFELETDRTGRVISGEVIICVPEARRRARQNVIPISSELLLYALHGLLHLSGFDDKTPAGFRKMHDMEDKLLGRLGVGAVFSASPANRRGKAGD